MAEELNARLQQATAEDSKLVEMIAGIRNGTALDHFMCQGLLCELCKGTTRLCVSNDSDLGKTILGLHRDAGVAAPGGRDGAMERLERTWTWPGLQKQVKEHVCKRQTCLASKRSNHFPHGLLMPLHVCWPLCHSGNV